VPELNPVDVDIHRIGPIDESRIENRKWSASAKNRSWAGSEGPPGRKVDGGRDARFESLARDHPIFLAAAAHWLAAPSSEHGSCPDWAPTCALARWRIQAPIRQRITMGQRALAAESGD